MEVKRSTKFWTCFVVILGLSLGFYFLNWVLFIYILGCFLSLCIASVVTALIYLICSSDVIEKFNSWLNK